MNWPKGRTPAASIMMMLMGRAHLNLTISNQEPQREGWGQVAEVLSDRTVEAPCSDQGDSRKYQVRPQYAAEGGLSRPLRFLGKVPGQKHERLHDENIDCNVDESGRVCLRPSGAAIQGSVPVARSLCEVGNRDRQHQDPAERVEHIVTLLFCCNRFSRCCAGRLFFSHLKSSSMPARIRTRPIVMLLHIRL